MKTISKCLKADWNAMFYNDNILYAVFREKVFTLQMKSHWNNEDCEELKKYAKDANVGDLDMNEVFAHYRIGLTKVLSSVIIAFQKSIFVVTSET